MPPCLRLGVGDTSGGVSAMRRRESKVLRQQHACPCRVCERIKCCGRGFLQIKAIMAVLLLTTASIRLW